MDKSSLPKSNSNHDQVTMPYQYQVNQDDEIDLKELLLALWKGKWTIIACTLFFSIGAVIYALTAQQWWSSKAKITLPQTQDFFEYKLQVKQFQPAFDLYQEDGSVLVSEALESLIDREELFISFVTEFNSNRNKRKFLDGNVVFQSIKSDTDTDTRRLYYAWFEKIIANQSDKKQTDIFDVTIQATASSDSYKMLDNYIEYVSNIVRVNFLRNLQVTVEGKKNELLQKKNALLLQAKQRLNIEIQKTEYALEIAFAANVSKPIQSLGENEIFAINLGSAAIKAKIKALKSVDNLSLFEPRLQQLESKLTLIKNTKIDNSINFESFRYLDEPQRSLNRDKPKRIIIAVLGTFLGGMLGVAIVLFGYAFRRLDTK